MNFEHTKAKANEIAGNVRNTANSFFAEQGKRKRAEELAERVRDNNILQDITAPRSRTPINERVAASANSLRMRKAMSLADDMGTTARSLQEADTFTPSTEEGKDMFGNDLYEAPERNVIGVSRNNQTASNPLAGAMGYTDEEPTKAEQYVGNIISGGVDAYNQVAHTTPEQDAYNRYFYDLEDAPDDSALYSDHSYYQNEELVRNPERADTGNRPAVEPGETDNYAEMITTGKPLAAFDGPGMYGATVQENLDALERGDQGNASFYIDNGVNDPEHRKSPMILGAELLRQQEAGIVPADCFDFYIDPNRLYDKAELMMFYPEYKPYMPDIETALYYGGHTISGVPAVAAGYLAHAREGISEAAGNTYTIDVDGTEVDGKWFDRNANAYLAQIDPMFQNGAITEPPRDGIPFTTYVTTWTIPNGDGDVETHYGSVVDAELVGYDPEENIALMRIHFSDGLYEDIRMVGSIDDDGMVTVSEEEFQRLDPYCEYTVYEGNPDDLLGMDDEWLASEDESSPPVMYVPDMVTPDGTTLDYTQVLAAYSDTDKEGGIVTDGRTGMDHEVSYSDLDMWDTGTFEGTDFYDEEGLHFDPTMLIDYTLQSAPYMLKQTGIPVGVSQALHASSFGADPYTYDPNTHSYALIAPREDQYGNVYNGMTLEQSITSPLATAAMYGSERIAGGIGPSIFTKSMNRWVAKNPTLGRTWARYGMDAAAEGGEEIISGHTFEELQRNGFSGYFANPVMDENGEVVTDINGAEIRDLDTSAADRLRNSWIPEQDINSFLGGAAVGGALTLPHTVYESFPAGSLSMSQHRYNYNNRGDQPVYEEDEEARKRMLERHGRRIAEAAREDLGIGER